MPSSMKLTSVEPLLVVDEDALGCAVGALDGTAGAEHFHALVVPEGAPPGVLDYAERTVLSNGYNEGVHERFDERFNKRSG